MTDIQRLCIGVEAYALNMVSMSGARRCHYCGISVVSINPDEFPHKDNCLVRLAKKVFAENTASAVSRLE